MTRARPLVRVVVVPLVAIALAAAVGSWASGREPDTRSSLTAALDSLPRATLVAGFTDWAAIRAELDLGTASTASARAALTDDASLRDLTTRSVLGGIIEAMDATYGWSAADLDWESYGRAPSGAAMVARFADSVSIDNLERRLAALGYVRNGTVWTLSAESNTEIGPELAATLGNLAFDPGRRLVVAADRPGYVTTVLAVVRGADPSALSVRPLADVAMALAGSDTAVVQSGGFACRATSLDALGADVLAQADAAVARAGALRSPTFTGRGLVDGPRRQTIRFAAAFDSPSDAVDQARVRAALSSGPFIGRTGRIEDSLILRDATTSGSIVTLAFALDPDRAAYMSGEGPALFAGCP